MEKNIINTEKIVSLASSRSGLSKFQIRRTLRAILGAVSKSVDDGGTVVIDNFGKFAKKTVKERTYVPPPPHNTPVKVPERDVVRFTPYKNILNYHIKY